MPFLFHIGDILFTYKKKNWFSRLIYLMSKMDDNPKEPEMSHVAVYVGQDLVVEATESGVALSKVDKYLNYKYVVRVCKLNLPVLKQVAFITSCNNKVGVVKYGTWQLVALFFQKIFGLKKVGDVSKGMTCCEFVAQSALDVGIKLTDIEPAETTPLDLYNSNILKLRKVIK